MDPYYDYQLALLRAEYRTTTALPITVQASLLMANRFPIYPFVAPLVGYYSPALIDYPPIYPPYGGGCGCRDYCRHREHHHGHRYR